jgi:hypothetical protein
VARLCRYCITWPTQQTMTMLLLLQTTNRQQEHTPAAEVGK